MVQPGMPVDQLEIFGQLQKDGPFQRFNQAAHTETTIIFKSQESVPNLPTISGEHSWTTLSNVQIDDDSTDMTVRIPVSEFEKRQFLLKLKDKPEEPYSLPVPSNDEIEGGKTRLMLFFESIYQESATTWLDSFVIDGRVLSACDLETLRNADCPNVDWEVAILLILMINARHYDPSALWLAMAKFGWKLASVGSLKMQGLISDISNLLSESTSGESHHFIKTRSKSAQMAIEVSNTVTQDGMVTQDGKVFTQDGRLENVKASLIELLKLDTEVRKAFGIEEGDARLVVNSWDNFSFQERLEASMIACYIMKIITASHHRTELLHLVQKLWKIVENENRNAGSLDLIFISVHKLRSEQLIGCRVSRDLCVVEWLASPLDLCMKIQKEKVLQFLEMNKIGSESKLVLLPFCNASDYNKMKSKKMFVDTNEHIIEQKMRRNIQQAKANFEKIEKLLDDDADAGVKGLFVYIAFCKRSSKVIQPERVSLFPNLGICLGKSINLVQACRIFNESAPALQQHAITFERSTHLYTAEQLAGLLTEQSAGSDSDCRLDMMQSSFDSFSLLSNVYNGNIGAMNLRPDRLCPRLSLVTATDANIQDVMKRIVLDWKLHAGGGGGTGSLFRRHNVGVASSRDIRGNISDNVDHPCDEEEMPATSSALGSSALDFEGNRVEARYSAEIHKAIVKFLSDSSFPRYIQVDFDEQDRSKVNSITYMLILHDTKTSKKTSKIQVSNNLVSMYVAHHRTKGRFVNCCCTAFLNKIGKTKSTMGNTESFEPWFFNTSRYNLFHEDSVKHFCIHIEVNNTAITDTFMFDTTYKWDEQTKSMNVEFKSEECLQNYKQSSILFTVRDGLGALGDRPFQDVKIVPIAAKNPTFANPHHSFLQSTSGDGKQVYSVDIPGENRHAFVKVLRRRFTNDSNPQNERHEQIICEQCESRLNSIGYAPCIHIMAVFEALYAHKMSDEEFFPYTHTSAQKRTSTHGGFYDPKRVDPECVLGEEETGFVYESYTNVKVPMEVSWIRNQMCFGEARSRPLAERKNAVLDGKVALKGKQYSYYEISVGELLKGDFPRECPKCSRSWESQSVKPMNVVIHMSDTKVVHTSVRYWVCACRFCVHTDGAEDGFWFLNQHLAVSVQLLWDLLNLQMQGCGMDFSTYCRTCNLQTQRVMRDTRNRFINRNQLSDLYFAFFSRLSVVFNQGCYGCIAEAKGFPKSFDHSEVQRWSKDANPSSRDVSDVGFDGLSIFFAKNIVFKKPDATMKEEGNDGTSKKRGSQKVSREYAFLQNDRCPIRTGGWDFHSGKYVTAAAASQDVRQCATNIRKGFFALGGIIKGTTAKEDWFIALDVSNPILEEVRRLRGLIESEHSRQQSLLLPLMLAEVCSSPTVLYNAFQLHKAQRLMQYVGMFTKQLAATNSVIALLKLVAIKDTIRFCEAVNKAQSESDWNGIMVEHAGLQSLFKSRLGTPGPAAHTLCVLLDYFCLDTTFPIQSELNMAICQSLRFVAERAQEVYVLYGLNDGKSPHPVRLPKDHFATWSNEDLKIKESQEPGNPIRDNGAYFFTKNGAKLRELPVEDSRKEVPPPDNDCRKPGFQRDRRAGRAAGKRMVFCAYCVRHGILIGYHIIYSGEGRKDPFFAIYVFKETSPHSTSYDFSCG